MKRSQWTIFILFSRCAISFYNEPTNKIIVVFIVFLWYNSWQRWDISPNLLLAFIYAYVDRVHDIRLLLFYVTIQDLVIRVLYFYKKSLTYDKSCFAMNTTRTLVILFMGCIGSLNKNPLPYFDLVRKGIKR